MNNLNLLYELLSDSEVTVTFTKKDGTERVMHCTQSPSLIPEDKIPKQSETKTVYQNQCRVFDLEKKEWRSFTPSSVTMFTHP